MCFGVGRNVLGHHFEIAHRPLLMIRPCGLVVRPITNGPFVPKKSTNGPFCSAQLKVVRDEFVVNGVDACAGGGAFFPRVVSGGRGPAARLRAERRKLPNGVAARTSTATTGSVAGCAHLPGSPPASQVSPPVTSPRSPPHKPNFQVHFSKLAKMLICTL
jgi:hypothetical protein